MDSAQKARVRVGAQHRHQVSILVIMDSAQKEIIKAIDANEKFVSILVIMDSAQKVDACHNGRSSPERFNPCYNG